MLIGAAASGEKPPSRRAGLGLLLLAVLAVFVVQSIAAIIAILMATELFDVPMSQVVGGADQLKTNTSTALGVLFVAELASAAAAFLLLRRWMSDQRASLRWGTDAWASLRLAMPVVIVACGAAILSTMSQGDPLIHPDLNATRILLIAGLVLGVGITEELLFRGIAIALLGGVLRPWYSIFVSAGVFGLVHIAGVSGGAPELINAIAVTLAVGIPFAIIRLVTNSLVGLIVAHAAIDFVSLLILGSLDLPDVSTQEAAGSLVMASLLALSYCLWFRRELRAVHRRATGQLG